MSASPAQAFTLVRDGVRIAGDRRGPREAATVLLVHGYPDDRSVWDAVAGELSGRFHVVRYDVRGCGESSAPRAQAAYALDELLADLARVIDHVSADRPLHLVGHDWGAIQGWEAVCEPRLAARIASFTALGAPGLDHAGHWLRQAIGKPSDRATLANQLLRSWYMLAFQLPGAPLAWRLGLDRAWPRIMRHLEKAPPGPQSHQRRNGMNGIAWYRANVLPRLRRPRPRPAQLPIQQIVALRDPHVHPRLHDSALPWASRLQRIEIDAGHWLPLSHPRQLSRLIGAMASA